MFQIHRYAAVPALAALAAVSAFSQQLSISGTIRDGSGVVRDAQITLRSPNGKISGATSNAEGTYRFDGLAAGAYELAATRPGFAPSVEQIQLTTESRTADLVMQVGSVSSSIDVNDVAGRGTASGMDVPNREIPSYVVNVSSRILQEQGVNDLASALENVSGVSTQVQYGVYEWYTIGGITQQSGNDFLYVDGMTLTGNRSATQLNNIEQVQVFKGPNSILYGGAGAGQGGMVNLVRKKPTALRTHDIQYRLGRWGLQEVTGATTGSVFGLSRLLYRIDASFSHRDGWRQNGANRFNIAPSLTWLINNKMRITANESLIRDRYTLDAGLRIELINRPGGFPFDRKMNPANDFQLTRDWQNQIAYTWNVTNRLIFNNSFFMRMNRDQYLDAETMGYNAALDQVTRAYLYFQHNRRPKQNQADLQGYYNIFGTQHHFLVRYDYSDQYNFTYRTGNAPGASNAVNLPLPNVPVPEFLTGEWKDPAPAYTTFPITRIDYSTNAFNGVTLQDQVNPVKWIGINFTLSRRKYDRRTRNDNYDNGTFVSTGAETHIENETKNNYRAGIALIPQQSWGRLLNTFQPYFSYNSSFNPVNQIQANGQPLDPVINQSFEVGNKWRGIGGRLDILTAVRRIQDQNRVINLGNQLFEQVGKATTYNFDMDIDGNLGRGVWLTANYGFADSLIDRLRTNGAPEPNGGRRFPHAPKHTSRVWLTKRINLGENTRLNVSLGGRYQGRYFANAANTARVPSRTTFDAALGVSRGRYDANVNFANLLNAERYFVSQINSGSLLYPGQPFSATLTVRYRFQ